jgi:hypothetical protein
MFFATEQLTYGVELVSRLLALLGINPSGWTGLDNPTLIFDRTIRVELLLKSERECLLRTTLLRLNEVAEPEESLRKLLKLTFANARRWEAYPYWDVEAETLVIQGELCSGEMLPSQAYAVLERFVNQVEEIRDELLADDTKTSVSDSPLLIRRC